MSKHIRWLIDQLETWVTNGVISREQADQIRALYPEPKAAAPWGAIVFSGLGAVIFGLGIILLLAFNWNVIPKEAKLALIFVALAGAHAGGIWLARCPDWRRQLGEAVCVVGTMFFGAGIWLIAQIYNIDEHFPNGFLIWGLGALAMAWALPSLAHGLLAIVLLCIWSGAEAWDFHIPVCWAPLLILLGTGVLAFWQRWRLLLFFTLAGFSFTLIADVGTLMAGLVIPVVMSVASLFLGLEVLMRRHGWFAESASVWGFFGWLGFVVCGYLLTFHGIVNDLVQWHALHEAKNQATALVYAGLAGGLALLAWIAVALPWLKGARGPGQARDCPYENWLVPLATAACLSFWFFRWQDENRIIAGIFNLVYLALAAAWMARGCREAELRSTILGSLLLAALVAGRYFDLFESLAVRGLVFVVVGGVLFAEGILYTRARRRLSKEGSA